MANSTGAQPIGGGSRLLGVNQLQTSIDSLTSAVNSLSSKMGGTSGPVGSGANFSSAPTLNQVSSGGNAGSPTMAGLPMIGSAGSAPTLNQQSSGGNGGWGSGVAGSVAATNIPGAISGVANWGSGKLGTMASLSSMGQYMSVYGGSPGWINTQMTTLNDIASNAGDLASGNALLAYSSGSWTGPNAMSRNMTAGANMAGFLNPTLGWNGSVSLSQQMYSQQMAANMMTQGYGTLPRTTSGKMNPMSQVLQGYLQRSFGGRSHVTQAQFNSAAQVGGRLNYNMQSLYGSNSPEVLSMLSAQNKLANAGYSDSQIQGIFNGAAKGNQASLADLSKAGISTNSIVQTLKNKSALSTQRSGEEESSYQQGLADSVGLLNKFNSALNKLLNGPLGKIAGYPGGFGTGGGGFINGAEKFLNGMADGGMMGGLQSILGGGAAAPAGGTSSSARSTSSSKVNTAVSGAAKSAVGWARQEIGVPYTWGAEKPGVGFDCSGLTQWAYKQSGVNIPRTSQQQWATLSRNHSIGLNQVQEGDLVFTAGSDGSYAAPGHVAMAVSNKMLIQAEQTGTNVMLTPYDPRAWDHAARPSGPGTPGAGAGASGSPTSGLAMAAGAMSAGGGYSEGGAMGSTNEADAVGGAAPGGGGLMSGMLGNSGGFSGSTGGSSAGAAGAPANLAANARLGKQLAAKRGWTGTQWNDLYALWQRESGWSNTARNGTSGAYGIAQALGHGPSNQYPGGQYLSANQPPTGSSNSQEQILWGLNYIASTYKNPAGAWQHEKAFNWYSRGTQNSNSGVSIVGEDGPEAVKLPTGSQVMTAGQTAGLLAQMQSGQSKMAGVGLQINLNIANGGIQVSGNISGSSSDVSNSAREIASQIGQYLEQESVIQKLAAGVSS